MKRLLSILAIILVIVASSCKKTAGDGGTSSIIGKVWVQNWNSTFTLLNAEYASADVDVYIIYGSDVSFGNKTKTGPDGMFEFKYLRSGKYKIYTYSKDKESFTSGNLNAPDIAVFKEVEITKKKQQVDAGTFQTNK